MSDQESVPPSRLRGVVRLVGRTTSLLVSIVIVLLLATGIWMGWRGARADFLATQVDTVLRYWEDIGRVESQEQWQFTAGLLTRARALRDNPEYLHMQALLDEWRMYVADAPVEDMETDIAYHREVIDSYRDALQLRPAWPESWAQIARLKAYLREFDGAFYTALRQALVTGQWERRVQILMIDIAGLSWPSLEENSQIRDELLGNVQATLGNSRASNAGMAVTILGNYEMLPLICPELDENAVSEMVKGVCLRAQAEEVSILDEILQEMIDPNAILGGMEATAEQD